MKKLLFVPFLLFFLHSCSSSDDFIPVGGSKNITTEKPDIEKKYQVAYKATKQRIFKTIFELNKITGKNTRSDNPCDYSGQDLVNYLIDLPPAVTDSLYNVYDVAQQEEMRDSAYNEVLNLLIEYSSEDEVQTLLNFQQAYIDAGGANPEMLEEACMSVSPTIQDCIIYIAANIDGYQISTIERSSDSWCLQQLYLNLIKSNIESDIADLVIALIPGGDVIGALVWAGFDFYSAIKDAHQFNMCCATHVS